AQIHTHLSLNQRVDVSDFFTQKRGKIFPAGQIAKQGGIAGISGYRIVRFEPRMYRRGVEDTVLVFIWQLAVMPLLHIDVEQRRQHSGSVRTYAALVTFTQRWGYHRRDLREPVGRDALVGVLNPGVGKTLKHHVAVGWQIDAIISQAGNDIFR